MVVEEGEEIAEGVAVGVADTAVAAAAGAGRAAAAAEEDATNRRLLPSLPFLVTRSNLP